LVRDPQDPGGESRSPGERDDDRELDSAAGIGPRVSAVFTAAEQAAEHILQMARAEAEDIRRSAESEIEALRAQRRNEAEREARALVEDARAEAEIIRGEATRAARAVEDAARRREQWIDEGIRLVIERAEWGRRGLHEVIERLEEFAVRAPIEWPELGPPPDTAPELQWPAARMSGEASSSPEQPGEDEAPDDPAMTAQAHPADEATADVVRGVEEEQEEHGGDVAPVVEEEREGRRADVVPAVEAEREGSRDDLSVAAELAAARTRGGDPSSGATPDDRDGERDGPRTDRALDDRA
jgi:hypothetical protein